MEYKNNSFLWRLYLISSILLIFGIGIGYKLFYLQFVEGEKYRKRAEDKTLKSFTVNSVRGNIFSEDGSLLARGARKIKKAAKKVKGKVQDVVSGAGEAISEFAQDMQKRGT